MFVSGQSTLYVISTLGKQGRHAESVIQIIKYLHKIGCEVRLIVIKPFLFEVLPDTMDRINTTISKLEPYANKQYIFSNEDLLRNPESKHLPIAEAWQYLTAQIIATIEEETIPINGGNR